MSVAVALVAAFSFSSFAQQADQCTGATTCAPTSCCQASDSVKRHSRPNPFAGLNLSAEQQTQIKELRKQYAPAAPQQKKQAIKEKRAEYLKSLKGILSSEQYTQFLENNYLNQTPGIKGGKKGPKQGHKKDGKAGKDKKERGEKKDKK